MRRSTSVSPIEPRPLVSRSSMPSIRRAIPSDPHGTICREAQRTRSSGCMGSSIGRPHVYSPHRAPGTASTLWSPAFLFSQVAASFQ